ncbi:MAG: response regulator [Thermodesulfobacteriota bacterium]|nr:response regulator [Thermodesulfobacteriota bacterium]
MGETRKILVVDDDPDLVESVEMMLKDKSYEVITAYDGIEGLQKAKEYLPDLIILDVMMPNKDGYTVCHELKSDPQYKQIPILLLTAVVSEMSKTTYTHRMGMEIDADDYIDKPVEPTELVKRAESLLQRD